MIARGPFWQMGVVLVAASCALVPTATLTPSAAPASGGTLRVVYPADQFLWGRFTNPEADPATLDPHLDGFSPYDTWELMRCCLGRTLLSTNGRATADGGARIQPDLAAALPEISSDGLTWTFRLKEGLNYGPPLQDVEIKSFDLVRSFHRLMSPKFSEPGRADARTMYSDIVGAQAYLDGDAASISGLESPDDYTLVIRITNPAGDLGARLALPMVVPIPESPANEGAPFGVAEGHDDGYGRFLVSSGPYILEGSADLDLTLTADQQAPIAGLVPGQRISLVRNETWDRTTDQLRSAEPDRIELEVVPTLAEAANEIYEARAHLLLNYGALQHIPDDVADAVRADPNLGSLHVDEDDSVTGITMNLAVPPFDDLNVRKAAALALDKAEMIEVAGPLVARVAHHMVPDAMGDNLLVDYRPYSSPGDRGDLEAAREMMRQSRYDTDGDGVCDAPQCQAVPALGRDEIPEVPESVRESLAAIGVMLELELRSFDDFFVSFRDPSQHYALYIPLGWVKDSLSPANFFIPQFYSPVAFADGGNGSLVGATPAQLTEWGYNVTQVPNVDARIEACVPLTGTAQFECWASLDQHMMENVLPSVSFASGVSVVLASPNVTEYSWDQLIGAPSFEKIELAP